ncbi:MAG: hypothetical protein HIU91_09890 [Acidobacteria bacterium]|nr:hypothetical protein [Acidobacteriota bacterium]
MKIQHHRHWKLKKLFITACCISIMFTSERACEAQCTQQPPNSKSAVRSGSIVYYSLDSSLQSIPLGVGIEDGVSTPIAQIQAAFSAWSAANQQSGGDGTTFVLAGPTDPVTVIVNAVPDTTGTI